MRERKTIKRCQYTIEEKNNIAKDYLEGKIGGYKTISLSLDVSSSVVVRWVKQYQEFGTTVDRRGKSTKEETPTKGRPKKAINLEDMNKEELIKHINMIEDVKKVQAYLVRQKKNIK